MDNRIVAVLLVIATIVVGTHQAATRVRRSDDAAAVPVALNRALRAVDADQGGDTDPTTAGTSPTTTADPTTKDPTTKDPTTTEPSTTEPSTTEPSTTEPSTTEPTTTTTASTTTTTTTAEPEKTSPTTKATESTPATSPSTTPTTTTTAATTKPPIQSRFAEDENPTTKKPEDKSTTPTTTAATSPSTTPSTSPSTTASTTPSSTTTDATTKKPASPMSRSNFEDEPKEKKPTSGMVYATSVPNYPFNPIPDVNGWANSGANAWTSATSSGYAGSGSFYYPTNGGFDLEGRSGFYEPLQEIPYYGGDYLGNGFFGPNPVAQPNFVTDPNTFQQMMEEHFKNLQRIWDGTNFPYPYGGFPTGFGSGPNTAPEGPQSAFSSIGLGPGGGYQSGFINPVGPGIESRFAEELPAPSGGSFGVFSSSSSSTHVGPDGKQVSHKQSTTGVNDNGKVTFRTVQD